jgi:hypothetical protein
VTADDADSLHILVTATVEMFFMDLGEQWDYVTVDRARVLRHLRVDLGCSLREIGEVCLVFFGDWIAPNDEYYGMVVCRLASNQLGEHYLRGAWEASVQEKFLIDVEGDIDQALSWRTIYRDKDGRIGNGSEA